MGTGRSVGRGRPKIREENKRARERQRERERERERERDPQNHGEMPLREGCATHAGVVFSRSLSLSHAQATPAAGHTQNDADDCYDQTQ